MRLAWRVPCRRFCTVVQKQETKSSDTKKNVVFKATYAPKKRYPLGNYPDYYSFRQEAGKDPRLDILQEDWFKGRRVLDIGCNSGWLTMEIGFNFKCSEVIGLDIDGSLIKHANEQLQSRLQSLQLTSNQNNDNTASPDASSPIDSTSISSPETNDSPSSSTSLNSSSSSSPNPSLLNSSSVVNSPPNLSHVPKFTFLEEDFVSSNNTYALFDTITCFSVTKWIHLNHGDNGIMQLFRKARKYLRQGGLFVVEPQAYESYEYNKIDQSPVTIKNIERIRIHPETFQSILQNKFGFKYITQYKIFSRKQHSFNRKIFIFQKN